MEVHCKMKKEKENKNYKIYDKSQYKYTKIIKTVKMWQDCHLIDKSFCVMDNFNANYKYSMGLYMLHL